MTLASIPASSTMRCANRSGGHFAIGVIDRCGGEPKGRHGVCHCAPWSENGAPDTIRTCDLCLRRVALYPAELRAQCLAVQRPNESNPLGVCCDIVKPVFSDWTQCRGHPGGPGGGGKRIAALQNSACFAIDPVVFAAITQTCRPPPGLWAAKASSPAPYRCAEKVIESACVINTAHVPYARH